MLRNLDRSVTIYEIAGFIGQAHPTAIAITNISSAVTHLLAPANNKPNAEIEAQHEQHSIVIIENILTPELLLGSRFKSSIVLRDYPLYLLLLTLKQSIKKMKNK